jgi:urease accessory protein
LSAAATSWLVWQLADSAFPTGGFAHSLGLEAAWQSGEVPDARALRRFVRHSLIQAGRGVLPLVNAAYATPERLADLDRLADAFLTNAVANRASRVQGRTLVATCARIWPSPRLARLQTEIVDLAGHVGPLTGVVFGGIGVPAETAGELVLFATVRGVLAAAVRLGIAGSYEAQRLLFEAASFVPGVTAACVHLGADDLAQASPIVDLLQAGHDRLYSRLFQS